MHVSMVKRYRNKFIAMEKESFLKFARLPFEIIIKFMIFSILLAKNSFFFLFAIFVVMIADVLIELTTA